MITTSLISKIVQLLLIALLGFILVKCRIVKSEDSMILSKISLYLLAPCAILNSYQIEYDADVLRGLLITVAAAALIHLALIVLMGTVGNRAGLNSVEKASVIYSNAANLVIPIVTYVLGEEWVVYCSGYIAVQSAFIWTHGVSLFQKKSGSHWKNILNINLIAIIVGILMMLCHIQLPEIVTEAMDSLGSMLGPIAMLVIGMLAAGMDLKKVFRYKRMYLIVALRLVAAPLVVLLVLKALMAAGVIEAGSYLFLVVFIAAITPPASTITQFAQVYGGDAEYAGAINLVATLCCILTMPLLVWLYFL